MMTLHYAIAACSLGRVLVAANHRGLCALLLGDDDDALIADLAARFPRAHLIADGDAVASMMSAARALVDGAPVVAAPPLEPVGTEFQKLVWHALGAIPAGKTVTYGHLAQAIGRPSATRAVAQACGANPIAIAIPCHRVVRSDGALAGYRWGIERKRELLRRERLARPGDALSL
ncbi:MAG: methylated-DNA--[protein]-cysteine S-methyltransferase [Myxococcales bacterium]|nr:methylated-DNA--[protein]-cysteine S-methyltransferase [Myxococcales bacterium]